MANVEQTNSSTQQPRLRVAEEWVGGRRLMPSYVMEDKPYRPELVIWLDVTNNLIVGSEAFKPGEPLSVEAELLAAAMKRPMAGKPRSPSSIRVADSALAALLRGKLGPDVRIEVAETPELDRVVKLMAASLARDEQDASYLEDGKISADTMRRFFSAAAKLWKMAPWKNVYDSQLLRLDCPALDARDKVVSIIGNLGESFGVLVFDSLDGFEAMAEPSDAHMAGKQLINLGTHIFSINFERGSDIPKAMRREIDQHGWRVPDANSYPRIQWIDPDRMLRPLTDRDVVFATACAEAITEFFARHGNDIAGGTFKRASERIALEDLPGLPTVEVAAPHPGRAWEERDESFDDEAELEAELARGHEIAESFVLAQKSAGRDEDWLAAAAFCCDNLYQFKINYADGRAGGWTAVLVEEYLLDYFPRKVSADEDLIAKTPELLTAFFDWAEQSSHVGSRTADAIRKRIESKRKSFDAAARDPGNFGMAKSLFMGMQDAGVDITKQSEVDSYIKTHNTEIAAGGRDRFAPLPNAKAREAKASANPTRSRWVWSSEGSPPDPRAPCPCGSGKRYKKCCMPR
jgi:hypothetical protein